MKSIRRQQRFEKERDGIFFGFRPLFLTVANEFRSQRHFAVFVIPFRLITAIAATVIASASLFSFVHLD